MTAYNPTQLPGDRLRKAVALFSELLERKPEKSRRAVLQEVEIALDLSPVECEFLNRHFSESATQE